MRLPCVRPVGTESSSERGYLHKRAQIASSLSLHLKFLCAVHRRGGHRKRWHSPRRTGRAPAKLWRPRSALGSSQNTFNTLLFSFRPRLTQTFVRRMSLIFIASFRHLMLHARVASIHVIKIMNWFTDSGSRHDRRASLARLESAFGERAPDRYH